MKNLFKLSKENSNYQSPKKIPDALFQDNTHCLIPTMSRLSPTFDQMLNLPPARQMFQRYLNGERLHGIMACLRELRTTEPCGDKCMFDSLFSIMSNESTANLHTFIDLVLGEDPSSADLSSYRFILDSELLHFASKSRNSECKLIYVYNNYISSVNSEFIDGGLRFTACLPDGEMLACRMLVELFSYPHCSTLPSFEALEKCIYDCLKTRFYSTYLKSSHHQQYQLQLLNSGLNALQLADFLYSDDFIMIITDFLESKGLVDYLSFLLAVINLAGTSGSCSFSDSLDVYSKFLVLDSPHFIELPASVTNSVVNKMCQINNCDGNSRSDPIRIMDANVVFECAFRPVYLFLEQYWLPEFLSCATYQRSVNHLNGRWANHSGQTRHRMYSENNVIGPSPTLTMSVDQCNAAEDARSDISADNTSVHSEPVMSISVGGDHNSDINASSAIWWPVKHIEDRFSSHIRRPMSLGSFDDLGRYHSQATGKRNFFCPNSTSSEILSTISELGSDLWSKLYNNPSNESHQPAMSPDEIARQIINDVHLMTLKNQ